MRSSSSSVWPENSSSYLNSSPSTSLNPQSPPPSGGCSSHNVNPKKCYGNIYRLLARREVAPRTKHNSKQSWAKASVHHVDSCGTSSDAETNSDAGIDARRGLISWVEAESLQHLLADYCPLLPPPRSTIAAAFSPDGKTLASTHGDHTVKIIDCQTGKCLKVLSGHRRTPWVVRFHPLYPDLLASGSLDHEVRLWDAKSAECIGSRDFYRPIASIAFHAQGEFLAVASGHKLHIWHYNSRAESSGPTVVLKTRRSLRAVHFHPHAAPFLLTAEVNDMDTSDSSMSIATSPGYLCYPPPTVYLADANTGSRSNLPNELPLLSLPFLIWPLIGRNEGRVPFLQTDTDGGVESAQQRVDTSNSVRLLTYSTPTGQYEVLLSHIEPNGSPEEQQPNTSVAETDNTVSQPVVDAMETDAQPEERNNHFFPFSDPAYWELPFLQGWLIGQSQAGLRAMRSQNGGSHDSIPPFQNLEHPAPSGVPNSAPSGLPVANDTFHSRLPGRSGLRHRSSRSHAIGSSEGPTLNVSAQEEGNPPPLVGQIQPEVSTSLAAAATSELPCTVKLRIWSHDVKDPCAALDTERCRLTIPHAVLCSEMGAHFSPCGRYLAACVACVLPNMDVDPGFHGQFHHDATEIATSPTRHPISAHKVMYELRVYSLETATFGAVLASRAIRAAHCLTSIQFSPTSEHLLLAYGRRHSSLLKSVVIDGELTVPIYTILEIYRVSDMELVRVLPSAEDEVNVACFHPSVGCGLVYGTKEGKLRILQYDKARVNHSPSFQENMLEVPTYALEG
ncbi:OLC1v1019473C1 [Oldenlandia corymbosa var. corymbosa]|uniref:OLC1v1019473C1 n=1 Tax=Oldenlandia corymbosa var. corymbosa TaxID=529605 RepID=A0AAV1EEJ9_OLDCO|nr:OLC1v1019473C1 [Oldenlandia corymbosa var. corymbosa]